MAIVITWREGSLGSVDEVDPSVVRMTVLRETRSEVDVHMIIWLCSVFVAKEASRYVKRT